MTRDPKSSEILAHWHFSPEEWREYVEYEKEFRQNEFGDFFQKAMPYIVATGIVIMLLTLLSSELAAIFIVFVFVAGFLGFACLIHWLIRQNELSAMNSRPGEVQITIYGVSTNGLWFDWEFEGNRIGFKSARRLNAHTITGKLNYLEFNCPVKIRVKGKYIKLEKRWRVPIPNGREAEADLVIQRLYQARATFSQSTDSQSNNFSLGKLHDLSDPNSFYGHDFMSSTECTKCGSSIEAVTHFKWKCKK